jgi:predicted O-methyltransferase YrrM
MAAGLESSIDARHAAVRQLVKELQEPLDFVFLGTDKHCYTQYFKAFKLVTG